MNEAIPATIGTALFIICSLGLQSRHMRRGEVAYEAACWALVPLFLNVARRLNLLPERDVEKQVTARSMKLWVIAISITISSLCKAEADVRWILPCLAPLLILFVAYRSARNNLIATQRNGLLESFLSTTVKGFLLAVIFIIYSFGVAETFTILYAILALAAAFVTFALLHDLSLSEDESGRVSASHLQDILQALCYKVVLVSLVAYGFQSVVYGMVECDFSWMFQAAALKALSWICLCKTVPLVSWTIVPSVWAFTIASGMGATIASSCLEALLRTVSSFIALFYIVQILPQSAKARSALWLFGLCTLVSFAATEGMIQQSSMSYSSYSAAVVEHPIEILARRADARFSHMLESQSRSFDEAIKEYIRRYSMPPPPGFEDWFEFATTHDSPIIDNFDVLYQTLRPFFQLSGNEITNIMRGAFITPLNDLWFCSLAVNASASQCHHPHRGDDRHISSSLDRLLSRVGVRIPAVDLLLNHLDEPSVLLPSDMDTSQTIWVQYSHQPIWDKLTQNCGGPNITSISTRSTNSSSTINFIENPSPDHDLCRHPEYQREHAFFQSPNKFWSIEALVPILSTGAFSTMGDNLFPSPAYTLEPEFVYEESADINWEKKSNNLHWAGSTTGGYAFDPNWRNFQRQRLATLAQNLETKTHQYLHVENGAIKSFNSTFLNTRLYDVSLTRLNQCDKKACSDQNAYFHKSNWVNKNRAFESRLAMDLDGNGISGRFYKFLASKSCPLKQTLLREWHDDRLVPWVHYVPVSMGMEELPELVSYLTLSEVGQARAEKIADAGRKWHGRALREADVDIYMYRLILEMARLQDPARAASKH